MTLQQKLLAKQSKKGFTLVELVVVIAILGILAAIAIPSVIAIIDNARKSASKTDAATVDAACKDYYSMCVSGQAPGEGSSKSAMASFTAKASIKDALEYANIEGSVSRTDMAVDVDGNIFDPEDPNGHKKSSNMTQWLDDGTYDAAGSLKGLYSKKDKSGNAGTADTTTGT